MNRTDDQYFKEAVEIYENAGELEIDTECQVDRAEGGAWVRAFVWVSDQDLVKENDK